MRVELASYALVMELDLSFHDISIFLFEKFNRESANFEIDVTDRIPSLAYDVSLSFILNEFIINNLLLLTLTVYCS